MSETTETRKALPADKDWMEIGMMQFEGTSRFSAGDPVPDWILCVKGEASLSFSQDVNVERHADGSVTVNTTRQGAVLSIEGTKEGSRVILVGAPTHWELVYDPRPDLFCCDGEATG